MMIRRRLVDRVAWWFKDRSYRFAFHYECRSCGIALHAWTDSPSVAASVAAMWRAQHDQCEEGTGG